MKRLNFLSIFFVLVFLAFGTSTINAQTPPSVFLSNPTTTDSTIVYDMVASASNPFWNIETVTGGGITRVDSTFSPTADLINTTYTADSLMMGTSYNVERCIVDTVTGLQDCRDFTITTDVIAVACNVVVGPAGPDSLTFDISVSSGIYTSDNEFSLDDGVNPPQVITFSSMGVFDTTIVFTGLTASTSFDYMLLAVISNPTFTFCPSTGTTNTSGAIASSTNTLTPLASNIDTASATIQCQNVLGTGVGSANVRVRYREVGTTTYLTTATQVINASGTTNHVISGLPGVSYDCECLLGSSPIAMGGVQTVTLETIPVVPSSVTTGGANGVTNSTADIQCICELGTSGPGMVYVQFGPLGSINGNTSTIPVNSDGTYTIPMFGLDSASTYGYECVLITDQGVFLGGSQQFTTTGTTGGSGNNDAEPFIQISNGIINDGTIDIWYDGDEVNETCLDIDFYDENYNYLRSVQASLNNCVLNDGSYEGFFSNTFQPGDRYISVSGQVATGTYAGIWYYASGYIIIPQEFWYETVNPIDTSVTSIVDISVNPEDWKIVGVINILGQQFSKDNFSFTGLVPTRINSFLDTGVYFVVYQNIKTGDITSQQFHISSR